MRNRKVIPKKKRLELWENMNRRCGYCGTHLLQNEFQIDHIIPFRDKRYSVEELNEDSNLMCSCRQCNYYKKSKSLEGFRNFMKKLPKRLKKYFVVRIAIKYGFIKQPMEWDGIFYFEKKNT